MKSQAKLLLDLRSPHPPQQMHGAVWQKLRLFVCSSIMGWHLVGAAQVFKNLACLFMMIALLTSCPTAASAVVAPQVCMPKVCVDVDVVSKPEDLAQGLSGRQKLDENKGMLFIFEKDGKYKFWMKDMNFNLDIIWLDKRGRIVEIKSNVPPCTPEMCPMYEPDKPARYVLEVNAGFVVKHRLKPGIPCRLP